MSRTRASGAWPSAPARLSAVVVLPSQALGLPIAEDRVPRRPVKLLQRVSQDPVLLRGERGGLHQAHQVLVDLARCHRARVGRSATDTGGGGHRPQPLARTGRPGHGSGRAFEPRAADRAAAEVTSTAGAVGARGRRRHRSGPRSRHRPLALPPVSVALGLLEGLEEHAHRITRSRARRAKSRN